jgi:hypothetical protein
MPAGMGYGTGLGSLATSAMDIGTQAASATEGAIGTGRKKKKSKSKATEALSGAASGAATGTSVAPGVGTAVGALVGAGAGLFSSNKAEKDAASAGPRPKHRRLTRAHGALRDRELTRAQALGSLSQSAFDLASSLR